MQIVCTKEEQTQLINILSNIQETVNLSPIHWVIKEDFTSKPPFEKNCVRCNWVEDFGTKCICRSSIYYGEEVIKMNEPIHKPCDQWKTLED